MFCTCSTKNASFVRVIWRELLTMLDAALRGLRLDGAQHVDRLVFQRDKFALALQAFHLRLIRRRLRDGRLVKL